MSHIVFCWEMGGGKGHLIPLSLIAAEMVASGHKVSFIARDLTHAPRFLAPLGIAWLQAPKLPSVLPARTLHNHADILRTAGYDTSDHLHAKLSAWRTLFELLRPDKVVCEYAPTAQLAARSSGIQCVCIDSGFSIPPISDPMPSLIDDLRTNIESLRISELQTLDVINATLRRIGATELPRFSCLYEDETWYRNWTELNHFGPHSPDRHLGQIFADIGDVEPQWPVGSGPKLFAYIKADHPFGMAVLRAAVGYGFRVLAYLPGFAATRVNELTSTNRVIVSELPMKLGALENDIEIGIWQSPTGGVVLGLEKGMRMLFLPANLEQCLACRAVERSGVAAYTALKPEDWRITFDKLMAMPRTAPNDHWKPANIPNLAHLLSQHSSQE